MATGSGGRGESGRQPRLAHRAGRYVISAIALLAIIAAVVVIRSRLQPEIRRAPAEFLPLTARAAFAVDTRPESPGARKMREVWPEADVRHLSERGAALAQKVVEWTGLEFDVGSGADAWYGDELVVAALAGPGQVAAGPRSAVVVARATSMRRARAALDRAVERPSRELEWRRSVVKRGRDRMTVWREPSGKETIAYATRDGCLLVGGSQGALEQCLEAADTPGQRLEATEAFRQGVSQLAAGALVWGYLDTAHLRRGLRDVVPGIWRGWREALRRYLGSAAPPRPRERPAEKTTGALAVALAPEKDGVRLRARYWRASPVEPKEAAGKLDMLAPVLPEGTVGYVLAHEPARWLPLIGDMVLSGERGEEQEYRAGLGLFALLIPWLGAGAMPNDLLAALVPVGEEGKTAVVLAAPSDQMAVPEGGITERVLSGLAWETVGDVTMVAADERALAPCRLAFEDPARRLTTEVAADLRFEIWARPAAVSKRLARFREIHVKGWESASGGEGDVVLKIRPRDLLGGG